MITSPLQRIPGSRRWHRHLLPLYPLALEQFDLRDYDLVISSESGPAKGILTGATTCHVCYCSTPMRYLWDMYPQYRNGHSMGPISRAIFSVTAHYLRMWDLVAASRVDYFIANSENVALRIRKHYRRDSTVIHPPVSVSQGYVSEATDDYYLVVGKLVDYKRVDQAIEACNRLRRPLRIIAVSQHTAREVQELYHPVPGKVSVIPNGVDVACFQSATVPQAVWKALALKLRLVGRYVLYAGIVRPRKNLEVLLAAMRILAHSLPEPVPLLVAGPSDRRRMDLMKLARHYGIENKIVETGYLQQDELMVLYRHAAVVALPSLLEGFCFPLVEAMASGAPLVVSDIPTHREIAGDAAIFVSPSDPEGFSKVILEVLSNPGLVEHLRPKGYARANLFSAQSCAEQTLALYNEVLNSLA